MAHDVVVVGSINTDLVVTVQRHPHPGETLLGGGGSYLAGGKGSNQAVAAARLGAATAIVGAVGNDHLAPVALEHLRTAAVDLSAVRTVPGPTGLAVIAVGDHGENTIIVIPGANQTVTPKVVRAAADILDTATICVLQAEIPLDSVEEAARLAQRSGTRVVLNVAPAASLSWETLRLANPLVVNEHEAATILGASTTGWRTASSASDCVTAETALAAARRFRARGVPSVVVTLGGAGSVVVDDTGEHHVAARAVPVRDTTGAGDAYVGALAAVLARGSTLFDAVGHASRVAGFSVQRLGAQASYPWKGDLLP